MADGGYFMAFATHKDMQTGYTTITPSMASGRGHYNQLTLATANAPAPSPYLGVGENHSLADNLPVSGEHRHNLNLALAVHLGGGQYNRPEVQGIAEQARLGAQKAAALAAQNARAMMAQYQMAA